MNRNAKSKVRDLYKYYEEGLTERQKHYIVQLLDEIVVNFLANENIDTPSAVRSYGEIFDLTQSDTFAQYQRSLLSRSHSDRHPVEDVANRLVQLEKARLSAQAMSGYLVMLSKQIDAACDNLKRTANAIFSAHQKDNLGVVTLSDKDDITWQMFTTAATPDSCILRRKQVRTTPSHRLKKKQMQGWEGQEHAPNPPVPPIVEPSLKPSLKPKGRSKTQ